MNDTTLWEKLRATGGVNGCSVRCKQEVVMKLTSVKSMIAKGVTVGLLAGAVALAAPAKAEAQQFAVGVQFGSPAYGYCSSGDYYARQRYEELCRQRALRSATGVCAAAGLGATARRMRTATVIAIGATMTTIAIWDRR